MGFIRKYDFYCRVNFTSRLTNGMIPKSKPSRGGIVSSSYETQSASMVSHDQERHKATDI